MPRPALLFAAAVPVVFGLASLAIGQDANWDLRNYHVYNPWAWLNGRLAIDLAPAGMPTYFNPLLDLPTHALHERVPARVLAFAMGAWHGVTALLLARIVRLVAPTARRSIVATLAIAGCLGAAFLSELGTTMGDDTTAPLLLASLALVLDPRTRAVRALAAGCVAGVAVGLKLTNAPYAVALVAAALATHRPRVALVVAAGVAAGVVVAYGPWAATLWTRFGNPFFPQFNAVFGAPLATATGVVDSKWFPTGPLEALLFPFAFTLFPMRVHEIPLANPLWPVAYVLVIAWLLVDGRRSWHEEPRAPRALLAFAVVAYLAWIVVFSIGRYLVVLETMLPLIVWMLLRRRFGGGAERRIAVALLGLAALVPLVRFETWGNAAFADPPYRVAVPPIDEPSTASVLVLAAPVAWMLPRFPAGLAFVGLNGNFPESAAYGERVDALVRARAGALYAILPGDLEEADSGLSRLNAFLASRDVRDGDLLCRYARAAIANAPAKDVAFDGTAAPACRFARDRSRDRVAGRDAASVADAAAARGYRVDLARCVLLPASIGATRFDYRFCPVDRP